MTIRQILQHRSGIQGTIFGAPPGKTRHDVVTLADYFPAFLHRAAAIRARSAAAAHDLLRLLNALREHKVPNAPEAGMVGIAGGAPGLNAVMEGDLPGGYDVIVLANLDPPAAERVGRLIRTALAP